ncbi:unnamed protein product, partial [Ilex paraguariensis]
IVCGGLEHGGHLTTLTQPPNHTTTTTKTKAKNDYTNRFDGDGKNGNEEDDGDEECDAEVWETLSKSFREVQSVLDQNRALIQQVNENHQSRIPDNLVKNVALIREINGNVSKVMGLYSDLSVNFSTIVHQRREITGSKDSSNSDSSNKVDSME